MTRLSLKSEYIVPFIPRDCAPAVVRSNKPALSEVQTSTRNTRCVNACACHGPAVLLCASLDIDAFIASMLAGSVKANSLHFGWLCVGSRLPNVAISEEQALEGPYGAGETLPHQAITVAVTADANASAHRRTGRKTESRTRHANEFPSRYVSSARMSPREFRGLLPLLF